MKNYLSFLIASLTILGYYGVNANIKAIFPSNPNNTFPRIIMKGTLPSMSEVTVCFWANPHATKTMYVVSYAHGKADDELLVGVDMKTGNLQLKIGNKLTTGSITNEKAGHFSLGEWVHLCFMWSNSGMVKFYKDGFGTGNKQYNDEVKGIEIRSGGVLMIGQEQDVYNGKFDNNESWEGNIYDVQIWDEVLQFDLIRAMANCKVKKDGNVFSWMKTPVYIMEGVVLSSTDLCKIGKTEID